MLEHPSHDYDYDCLMLLIPSGIRNQCRSQSTKYGVTWSNFLTEKTNPAASGMKYEMQTILTGSQRHWHNHNSRALDLSVFMRNMTKIEATMARRQCVQCVQVSDARLFTRMAQVAVATENYL